MTVQACWGWLWTVSKAAQTAQRVTSVYCLMVCCLDGVAASPPLELGRAGMRVPFYSRGNRGSERRAICQGMPRRLMEELDLKARSQ